MLTFRYASGLDCWGPVLNLARDPRWGRNGEAGAEDPYLMSTYVDYVSLAVYIPPSRYVYNIYMPGGVTFH